MVMPTPLMEELYEALLTTELSVIEALKPGRQLSEAFEKGMKEFKEKKPDYAQYLVKSSFGYVFYALFVIIFGYLKRGLRVFVF